MSFSEIHKRCLSSGNKVKAEGVTRFFKTGKGQYGEGDIFVGLNASEMRSLAKEFKELELGEIKKLFESAIHEERMIGISILNFQYEQAVKKKMRNGSVISIRNIFHGGRGLIIGTWLIPLLLLFPVIIIFIRMIRISINCSNPKIFGKEGSRFSVASILSGKSLLMFH